MTGPTEPDRSLSLGNSNENGCSSRKRARKESRFFDLNVPAQISDRNWYSCSQNLLNVESTYFDWGLLDWTNIIPAINARASSGLLTFFASYDGNGMYKQGQIFLSSQATSHVCTGFSVYLDRWLAPLEVYIWCCLARTFCLLT